MVDSLALNPAGALLAWVDNSTPNPGVIIFELDSRAVKRRINLPADMKLRSLDWADNDTLRVLVELETFLAAALAPKGN